MIVWIASYPKSGNTWIRSLLCSYFFSEDGEFNFDLLKNIPQFSNNLSGNYINDSNYQSKIVENWIPSQKIINKDKKIHFLKTHNALCTINGNKFTDEINTKAVIYIVRDPRNLITSLSNHYSCSLDEALNFMTNKRKIIFEDFMKKTKIEGSLHDFNFLTDWSGHYQSWKNISFCPIKIIKYEDIILNTRAVFISLLEFLSKFIKVKIENIKLEKAISSTSFKALRKLEDEKGFLESAITKTTKKNIKFFNLGQENDWKKILDDTIAKKLNIAFKNEMGELKYF